MVGRDAVPAAHLAMVDLAVRTGQWKVAVEHLEEVIPQRPDLLIILAVAYRQQGNEFRAISAADRAAGFLSGLVREDPQDVVSRRRWSEALVFQRKLSEAIKVLQAADGIQTDPRYGNAIAQIFLLRMAGPAAIPTADELSAPADALLPANRPASVLEVASRIELLAQALHYAPHHPGVLNAVARLSTEESPNGDQARVWLKRSVASGKAPATVHLILGTAATSKGDLEQAAFHLEQANQRDPKMADAANNLAYVLARTDPPRMEQALQLIEAALQAMPRNPEIHETRGQILLMVGRYSPPIGSKPQARHVATTEATEIAPEYQRLLQTTGSS